MGAATGFKMKDWVGVLSFLPLMENLGRDVLEGFCENCIKTRSFNLNFLMYYLHFLDEANE